MQSSRKRVRFPYGISNIDKLMSGHYWFVDKTPFVRRLEEEKNYVSFLRPRRMGKSLFVSILEYYYGLEHQDKFERIFSTLDIGQNPTPLVSSYHVMKFDFSAIDTSTEEKAFEGFLFKIQLYTKSFFDKYYPQLSREEYQEIDATLSPERAMEVFLSLYNKHLRGKIYLIIDEYDHFINEILIQDLEQFKRAVTKNGYVRKFYEVIKVATQQNIIDRVFITGVSPVTLDALTSGFNIITHLSTEFSFYNLLGFTEEQVSEVVDLVLEDPSRKDKIMEDLQLWYNGYKFNKYITTRIYNSDMVLYFLEHFQVYQTYPEEMLDVNIAPDYGKLKKMFEIQNPEGNYALIEKIIYEGKITVKLVQQFTFDKGFLDNQFISFLFYMGYLTISGEAQGLTEFQIPNLVIKELYWDYFAWLITEREHIPYNEDNFMEAVGQMTLGNLRPFMEKLEEVLNILSNRDYQRFDEKYIKIIMIAFASQAKIYYIPSERETPAGYIDLLFLAPENKKIDYEYIFELKYLKKADADDSAIAAAQKQAKKQILAYISSDTTLKAKKNLRAYTLVFVKNQLLIEPVVVPKK